MSKSSEIKFNVTLDENHIPEKINWLATDAGMEKQLDTKAIMISVYDTESEETLRMDLWTKEMRVDEMKRFFHQTIISMADTLQRATNEDAMASDMREFGQHFAKQMFS
ncbi:MAG: gliding motility protein GldC [Flavobacteriales bacterium]|nr:gliding motility protein GldC [Flavobacteriales bacterium]